jgi:hypothetical protein
LSTDASLSLDFRFQIEDFRFKNPRLERDHEEPAFPMLNLQSEI